MKTITIKLPDFVELDEKEAKMYLASTLYEKGKITPEQACQITGYSRETFLEFFKDFGKVRSESSLDELEEYIKNASRYSL